MINYNRYKKFNFVDMLLLMGLVLIPFTSLPVMPSDYRPISVFFLMPIALVLTINYISRYKIRPDIFYLLLFFFFATLQSITMLGDISHSLRYVAPLFLGIGSYIAMQYYLIRNDIEKTFRIFISLYLFILIIGSLELLSMKGVLPHSFKEIIGTVFSSKVSSRVQLITSEGSWAAKIIIFAIPIYLYFYYKNGYFYKSFYFLILLFILIFSLEGFAIILTTFFMYFLYNIIPILYKTFTFKYKIKYYLYFILFFLFFIFLVKIIMSTQSGYSISRIYKFLDADSFWTILSLDGSTFIRIIYPYIGFEIFFDHPYGVGLGGYAYYFNQYINNIPVDYSNFREVIGDIETVSADPKSLYAKIVSETGLVGIVLFFMFLKTQLKYLKLNIKVFPSMKPFFMFNIFFGLSSVLQFGSFAYLPFWFSFAVNSAYYFKSKRIVYFEKKSIIANK